MLERPREELVGTKGVRDACWLSFIQHWPRLIKAIGPSFTGISDAPARVAGGPAIARAELVTSQPEGGSDEGRGF